MNDKENSLQILDEYTNVDLSDSATLLKIRESSLAKINPKPLKKKRKFPFLRVFTISVILLCLLLGSLGFYVVSQYNNLKNGVLANDNTSLFDLAKNVITQQKVELKGQSDGRTNFLIAGADSVGGLTDTLILASYYYNEKKMVTLNIPRDFHVITSTFNGKINSYYALNNASTGGKGMDALADLISKEFAIPIHYWVNINFAGFISLIDQFGGVDVDVERAFTDCEYPTDDYKTLYYPAFGTYSSYILPCPSFAAGIQKMDGKRALIYSRSRHGTGVEGSDFARSKRQSKVMAAVMSKINDQVKSGELVVNPNKIKTYLDILGQNVKASPNILEISAFFDVFKDFDAKNGFSRVVWYSGNEFLGSSSGDSRGYVVLYLDGSSINGKDTAGKWKQKARDVIKNLLTESQKTDQISPY